jgi:hypothetical protein
MGPSLSRGLCYDLSLFYYTSIDAPEGSSIMPSFIEATSDRVYVRFHGKNRENWFKRNITAAERFKYLYSERELRSLAHGFDKLEEQGVKRAYAIFNNCYQNYEIMNGGGRKFLCQPQNGKCRRIDRVQLGLMISKGLARNVVMTRCGSGNISIFRSAAARLTL